MNEGFELEVGSLEDGDDFRDRCIFLDIFLVVGFALSEISSFDELSHFLVDVPKLAMRPAFHLLAVEFQEGNVSGLLNHRPFGILSEAFEIARAISRDAEGPSWDFRAHEDIFVDFKQHLGTKCGHFSL